MTYERKYMRIERIENQYSRVKRWLRKYLIAHAGTAFVNEIMVDAKAAGFSENTIHSVRSDAGLNISVKRQGFGRGGRWFWELPMTEKNIADVAYNIYKGDAGDT